MHMLVRGFRGRGADKPGQKNRSDNLPLGLVTRAPTRKIPLLLAARDDMPNDAKEAVGVLEGVTMTTANRLMTAAVCSVVTIMVGASAVFANGLGENRAWQFDTANDKIAKASIADLREKKKGGYYDGFDTNINNTYTTNIAGDQVNCNLTASAIGNTASNGVSSNASSPVIDMPGNIGANATGNSSSTATNGFTRANGDGNSASSSATGNGNSGTAGQLSNTSQGNTDSPQNANVDNSSVSGSVDGMNSSGGTSDVALNSEMGNTDSPQTASVADSQACGFSESAAAPLN